MRPSRRSFVGLPNSPWLLLSVAPKLGCGVCRARPAKSPNKSPPDGLGGEAGVGPNNPPPRSESPPNNRLSAAVAAGGWETGAGADWPAKAALKSAKSSSPDFGTSPPVGAFPNKQYLTVNEYKGTKQVLTKCVFEVPKFGCLFCGSYQLSRSGVEVVV